MRMDPLTTTTTQSLRSPATRRQRLQQFPYASALPGSAHSLSSTHPCIYCTHPLAPIRTTVCYHSLIVSSTRQNGSEAIDARLKRLEELQASGSGGPRRRERHVEAAVEEEEEDSDADDRPTRRGVRAVVEAAVEEDEEEDEDDDEEIERRRQRMRERARERAAAETDELAIEDDDDAVAAAAAAEGEEDSESEYETDSEDDMPAVMPVFVSKSQRDTIRERDEKDAADIARQEELAEKLKQRAVDSRDLVAKTMQQELNAEHRLAEDDIDDEDDE